MLPLFCFSDPSLPPALNLQVASWVLFASNKLLQCHTAGYITPQVHTSLPIFGPLSAL